MSDNGKTVTNFFLIRTITVQKKRGRKHQRKQSGKRKYVEENDKVTKTFKGEKRKKKHAHTRRWNGEDTRMANQAYNSCRHLPHRFHTPVIS